MRFLVYTVLFIVQMLVATFVLKVLDRPNKTDRFDQMMLDCLRREEAWEPRMLLTAAYRSCLNGTIDSLHREN